MILPGVNVQWPWSALLLGGTKRVETRRYPLPAKYVGRELAIIETPGPRGRAEAGIVRARVTGVIIFDTPFRYDDQEQWQADYARHRVPHASPFRFDPKKPTWGWPVRTRRMLDVYHEAPRKRGIVFCSGCRVA